MSMFGQERRETRSLDLKRFIIFCFTLSACRPLALKSLLLLRSCSSLRPRGLDLDLVPACSFLLSASFATASWIQVATPHKSGGALVALCALFRLGKCGSASVSGSTMALRSSSGARALLSDALGVFGSIASGGRALLVDALRAFGSAAGDFGSDASGGRALLSDVLTALGCTSSGARALLIDVLPAFGCTSSGSSAFVTDVLSIRLDNADHIERIDILLGDADGASMNPCAACASGGRALLCDVRFALLPDISASDAMLLLPDQMDHIECRLTGSGETSGGTSSTEDLRFGMRRPKVSVRDFMDQTEERLRPPRPPAEEGGGAGGNALLEGSEDAKLDGEDFLLESRGRGRSLLSILTSESFDMFLVESLLSDLSGLPLVESLLMGLRSVRFEESLHAFATNVSLPY